LSNTNQASPGNSGSGIDVRAEDHLRGALDHEGDADRRHEQGEAVLVGERTEHEALHDPGGQRHDGRREGDADHERGPERQTLCHHEVERANQRQAGEQHHRALREVEHAGGLEDQHEAERDQRIQHARQQAADQHFEELTERQHQWATPR
jgi:hypothetical protein